MEDIFIKFDRLIYSEFNQFCWGKRRFIIQAALMDYDSSNSISSYQ